MYRRMLCLLVAACMALLVPAYAAAAVESPDAPAAQRGNGITAKHLVGEFCAVFVPEIPGAQNVDVRAWTEVNGQDDMVTYRAQHLTDGSWRAVINTAPHGGGWMSAEIYADGQNIGRVDFAAPVPDGGRVLVIPRMATYYTILASNLPDAASVRIPVWSTESDEKDIIWYDARNNGNGVWSAQINTAKQCGGPMYCCVYADGVPVVSAAFTAKRTAPVIRTELQYGTRYDIVMENLWADNVQVPTWGEQGGQDDVIWYTANKTAPGTWRASINAGNHEDGTICSHVYADGATVGRPVYVEHDFLSVTDGNGSSTSAPDLSKLSRKKIGWGFGGPKHSDGRPESSTQANEQYGMYDADFIGPAEKKIYLTFDEGYENGYTPQILDVLKKKGVKAVFFVTADFVKDEPGLVQRIIDEGHEVGNHSVHHPSYPDLTDAKMSQELMGLHRILQERFDYDMRLSRAPYGEYCDRDLALSQALGYRTVFWSYAYKDWDPNGQPGASAALSKVKNALHPGAIYLLHAVSRDNAQMLGDFIDYVRAQGYTIEPYPETL